MTSAVALEPVGDTIEFPSWHRDHSSEPSVRTEANAPESAVQRRPIPVISIVQPAQFATLRAVWLRALEDSPSSFAADPDREASLPRKVWRRSVADSTWVVAWINEEPVGLARCLADPDDPTSRYIESVWVDPRFRRKGLVAAMLERLETRARRSGATRFRLWVLDGNSNAVDAYTKLGFAEDGMTSRIMMPLVGKTVPERRMTKELF
jgi:ribosomal protein S18 acetylase RimI-like enzyme